MSIFKIHIQVDKGESEWVKHIVIILKLYCYRITTALCLLHIQMELINQIKKITSPYFIMQSFCLLILHSLIQILFNLDFVLQMTFFSLFRLGNILINECNRLEDFEPIQARHDDDDDNDNHILGSDIYNYFI